MYNNIIIPYCVQQAHSWSVHVHMLSHNQEGNPQICEQSSVHVHAITREREREREREITFL